MFIRWKDEYLLGHHLIDYDHQTLVNLTNELHTRIESSEGSEQISLVIGCLEDYVKRHFAREEKIFVNSDYPKTEEHRAKHREIEKTVLGIKSLYERDPKAINEKEVLDFLKNWLIHHILKTDRGMIPYIEK